MSSKCRRCEREIRVRRCTIERVDIRGETNTAPRNKDQLAPESRREKQLEKTDDMNKAHFEYFPYTFSAASTFFTP